MIKIRVWDKRQKRMVYYGPPVYIHGDTLVYNTEDNECLYLDEHREVDLDKTEMLSTGITANGVEIYESDLIGYEDDPSVFEVVFVDCAFRKKYPKWGKDAYPYLTHHDLKYIKVIGNIYENPELLKRL